MNSGLAVSEGLGSGDFRDVCLEFGHERIHRREHAVGTDESDELDLELPVVQIPAEIEEMNFHLLFRQAFKSGWYADADSGVVQSTINVYPASIDALPHAYRRLADVKVGRGNAE